LKEELQSKAVFRIAVLSIVLALAARPSATLLCSAWCDRTPAAPSAAGMPCHHNTAVAAASASVAAGDTCESFLDASAFIREDTDRLASPSSGHDAVLIPRHQLPRLTGTDRPAFHGSCERALENRPFLAALRI
jgi:hypothetical protein